MPRLDLERIATSTFTSPLGTKLRYDDTAQETKNLLHEVEGLIWVLFGWVVRSELDEESDDA